MASLFVSLEKRMMRTLAEGSTNSLFNSSISSGRERAMECNEIALSPLFHLAKDEKTPQNVMMCGLIFSLCDQFTKKS